MYSTSIQIFSLSNIRKLPGKVRFSPSHHLRGSSPRHYRRQCQGPRGPSNVIIISHTAALLYRFVLRMRLIVIQLRLDPDPRNRFGEKLIRVRHKIEKILFFF